MNHHHDNDHHVSHANSHESLQQQPTATTALPQTASTVNHDTVDCDDDMSSQFEGAVCFNLRSAHDKLIFDPVFKAFLLAYKHEFYEDALFIANNIETELKCYQSRFLAYNANAKSKLPVDQENIDVHARSSLSPFIRCKYAYRLFKQKAYKEAKEILLNNCAQSSSTANFIIDNVLAYFGDSAAFVLNILGRIYIKEDSIYLAAKLLNKSYQLSPFIQSTLDSLLKIRPVSGIEPDPSILDDLVQFENLDEYILIRSHLSGLFDFEFLPLSLFDRPEISSLLTADFCCPLQSTTATENIFNPLQHSMQKNEKLFDISGIHEISPSLSRVSFKIPTFGSTPLSNVKLSSFNSTLKNDSLNPASGKKPLYAKKPITKKLMLSETPDSNNAASSLVLSPSRDVFNASQEKIKKNSKKKSLALFNSSSIKENSPLVNINAEEKVVTRRNLNHDAVYSINPSVTPHSKHDKIKDKNVHTKFVGYLKSLRSVFEMIIKSKICTSKRNYKEAIQVLNCVPPAHASNLEIQYLLFINNFLLRNFSTSVYLFQNILKVDKYWTKGIDLFSTCLYEVKDLDLLFYHANFQKKLNKLIPQCWVIFANLYSLAKDRQRAIVSLEHAIKLDNTYCYPFYLLGIEFTSAKDNESASTAFYKCVSLDPFNPKYWNSAGLCMSKKQSFSDSVYCFTRARTLDPKDQSVLCNLAVVHQTLGELGMSKNVLTESQTIDPSHIMTKYQLAKTYSLMALYGKSNALLDDLLGKMPRDAAAYMLKHINHKMMGNTIEASQCHVMAFAIDQPLAEDTLVIWKRLHKQQEGDGPNQSSLNDSFSVYDTRSINFTN